MTLEEAKKLKLGDRVLVEAEVICSGIGEPHDSLITSCGNVAVKMACSSPIGIMCCGVAPEAIRKKIETSRKFKKGDIVVTKRGALYFVIEPADGRRMVRLARKEDSDWELATYAHELTLICAAEDRADRKGVA